MGEMVYICAGTGEATIEEFNTETTECRILRFRLPYEGSACAMPSCDSSLIILQTGGHQYGVSIVKEDIQFEKPTSTASWFSPCIPRYYKGRWYMMRYAPQSLWSFEPKTGSLNKETQLVKLKKKFNV
jgi:hypothetical protein